MKITIESEDLFRLEQENKLRANVLGMIHEVLLNGSLDEPKRVEIIRDIFAGKFIEEKD